MSILVLLVNGDTRPNNDVHSDACWLYDDFHGPIVI